MKTVYMDHAATTALNKEALEEMLPYFTEDYGNPSAVYNPGQTGKNALEKCRDRVAKCIGALRTEIYFTAGGTESDNWVIRSVAKAKKAKGKHIISSTIEHNAVRKTLLDLEEEGFEITFLEPDQFGHISPEALEAAIRPDTILITIMLANNVVGTILDIESLSKVARKHHILMHTDAVQAVGHIPLQVKKLGVDFMSMSAHKFNGPKGVGALYVRIPNRLKPYMTGGGQEKEGRSGTENVPGIVGMAKALELSVAALPESVPYLNGLRDRLIEGVLEIPDVWLTGDPDKRLPGFASFVIADINHSVLLVNALNELGYCVSSGSACSASSKEASHVLLGLGFGDQLSKMSLRVTLGMDNSMEDVENFLGALKYCVEKIRSEQVSRAPRLEGRVKEASN